MNFSPKQILLSALAIFASFKIAQSLFLHRLSNILDYYSREALSF
jgi:hypothetical protein